jgi:hypothetical protein
MIRLLSSKNLVASFMAADTGMALYFRVPFPETNIFLQMMALRSPSAFGLAKYSCILFLFSTPYIAFSMVFSGIYIFTLRATRRIRAGRLPCYPEPRKREQLFLVLGEVHHPRKYILSENPLWLVIPARSLFTGVAILRAIGTGKTSCCMYPFAEQILAYRTGDDERKIGGLVLEVKGGFCHRVREILSIGTSPISAAMERGILLITHGLPLIRPRQSSHRTILHMNGSKSLAVNSDQNSN